MEHAVRRMAAHDQVGDVTGYLMEDAARVQPSREDEPEILHPFAPILHPVTTKPAEFAAGFLVGALELPLLGSNQDSPDPESGVLPVTPRGRGW
jgi:hypothetical protein